MRVALIADIHGNIVALDAALAEIQREGVDQMVCLGDVAATGPRPREVLERLRSLGCPNVMGNADAELLDPPPADSPDEFTRHVQEMSIWAASLLSEDDKVFLRSFQPTVHVALDGGATLLCFHGSPRSYDEKLETTTPDGDVAEMLAAYPAQVYAGGHTHVQLLRRFKDALIINAGTIGLPLDPVLPGPDIHNPTWAEYALVSIERGAISVSLRRVAYDLAALTESVRGTGMPHAEEWLADWVQA